MLEGEEEALSPRLGAFRTVTLLPNGSPRARPQSLTYSIFQPYASFLTAAANKMGVDVRRVFDSDGNDVDDVGLIADGDVLYVSTGGPFVAAPDPASEARVGAYRPVGYLGRGSFGKVYKAVHHVTGEAVALKFIARSTMDSINDVERVSSEIQCLESLEHANVMKLIEVVSTEDAIVFVLEFAGGGDLRAKVQAAGCLSEDAARPLFQQILSGVEFCHRRKIVHHDLKLENILLSEDGTVKIADFGLSVAYRPGSVTSSTAGSLPYLPPEVFGETPSPGPTRDAWALGVILYAILCGTLPFHGDTEPRVQARIVAVEYSFPPDVDLSDEAKDMIGGFFARDPSARLTAITAQRHPWLQSGWEAPSMPPRSTMHSTSSLTIDVTGSPASTVTRELSLPSTAGEGEVSGSITPTSAGRRRRPQSSRAAHRRSRGLLSVDTTADPGTSGPQSSKWRQQRGWSPRTPKAAPPSPTYAAVEAAADEEDDARPQRRRGSDLVTAEPCPPAALQPPPGEGASSPVSSARRSSTKSCSEGDDPLSGDLYRKTSFRSDVSGDGDDAKAEPDAGSSDGARSRWRTARLAITTSIRWRQFRRKTTNSTPTLPHTPLLVPKPPPTPTPARLRWQRALQFVRAFLLLRHHMFPPPPPLSHAPDPIVTPATTVTIDVSDGVMVGRPASPNSIMNLTRPYSAATASRPRITTAHHGDDRAFTPPLSPWRTPGSVHRASTPSGIALSPSRHSGLVASRSPLALRKGHSSYTPETSGTLTLNPSPARVPTPKMGPLKLPGVLGTPDTDIVAMPARQSPVGIVDGATTVFRSLMATGSRSHQERARVNGHL